METDPGALWGVSKRLAALWCHIETLFEAKRDGDARGRPATFSIRNKAGCIGCIEPLISGNPHERTSKGLLPKQPLNAPNAPGQAPAEAPPTPANGNGEVAGGLLDAGTPADRRADEPCRTCGLMECDCFLTEETS